MSKVNKMVKQNKYAVIRIQGHQHKVSEGEELLVDKLGKTKAEPEVLLIVNGDPTTQKLRGASTVKVGNPTLADVKVKIKVLTEIEKGKKIDVLKYKAKSRYRKHIGFRPKYSRLLIEKIS